MRRWTRIGDFALTDDLCELEAERGPKAQAILGLLREDSLEIQDLRRFLWELGHFDIHRMSQRQVLSTLDHCLGTGMVRVLPWARMQEILFTPRSSDGRAEGDADGNGGAAPRAAEVKGRASRTSGGSTPRPRAPTSVGTASSSRPPPATETQPKTDISDRKGVQPKSLTDVPRASTLGALHAELAQIGARLRTDGFTPRPDEELRAAIARGDYDDVRFVVSLQKNKASQDEPVGYRRPDTGRTTMWTAPYDAMKAGDLSAPLLCALNGTEYDPNAKYQLFLLDKGPNYKVDGSVSLVPTFEKLAAVGSAELSMDDPTDPTRDPRVLEAVMTPQMQETYRKSMEAFWAEAKTRDWSEYMPEDIEEFAAEYFETPEERLRFEARHLYRTQIGANAFFRGDGATEFVPSPSNVAAIAADGITFNSAPGKLGMPELLTIEKNPPTIRELQNQGSLLAIAL